MTVSDRVLRMLQILGLEEAGIVSKDLGPFAIFEAFNIIFAVYDGELDPKDDQKLLEIIEEMRTEKPRLRSVDYQIRSPREALALIATAMTSSVFTDNMGNEIRLPELRRKKGNTLLPDYKRIQQVLEQAGFEFTGE